MKATTIKNWFHIHKWTSLISTIFLLMLCITGLPLIFTEEIDHMLEDDIEIAAPANGEEASVDMVIKAGMDHLPGNEMKYAFWDEKHHPGQVFLTMADSSEAPIEADHYLTMNAKTATVLENPPNEMTFMLLMYYLHVEMLAGIPGKLFLGLMGTLFFVAIISGVVLYGPIMKKYDFGMIRAQKSKRLKWLDLHNLLGIVTLVWASVVGLTGVINTLADPAIQLWRANDLAEMVADYKDQPKAKGELASLDDAIAKAEEAAPDMEVSFVAFPGTLYSSSHHYAIYLIGNTPLTSRIIKPALIDAKTGEFTAIRDLPWYLKTILISQPFHFGDYGGLPMKILWTIFDLATIVVLISGLYLWFARRKAKSEQLARLVKNAEYLSAAQEKEDEFENEKEALKQDGN
ncbi:PepSY-associated TM helix domain-containing protein [Albibacterium indicum]|uniref:PepSY-associated TM helix domain-containing protein n=1 Tax=Albibacterium indicum TaxID=2292082 RepID=UPI000E4CAA66|nr:PepSY-associated TM helix domain-containing protein [Pedobacter indicus]